HGTIDDDQGTSRGRRHHRPRRIRRWVAERARVVGQRHAASDVDGILANAGILLALAAQTQYDAALDLVEVVQAVRQLGFDRAPIDDVDQTVDPRKLVA